MNVAHIMQSTVETLEASETLDIADDIMQLGRVRHLPVLEHGKLVGVLSQRDLLAAAVSSLLQFDRAAQQDWLRTIHVKDAMTPSPVIVRPSTPVRTAVALMLEHRIGCLPVVDDERLVGLVTETDCLRCLEHVLDTAALKSALPEFPQ